MIEPETIRVNDLATQLRSMAEDITEHSGIPCEISAGDWGGFTVTFNAGGSQFWERVRFSSVSNAIFYLRGVVAGLQAVGQWQR